MEFALIIPIMVFAIPLLAIWTRHQQKMAEAQVQAAPKADERMLDYVRELEDRVRVLERIVTDKGYDVANQIEALRDARALEAKLDSAEKELR